MENLDNFGREAIIVHYRKSTSCTVSKDKWDTKEDTGKSMMDCTYCGMSKVICWAEATSNSDKIKPVCSLSHYRVTLV